MLPLISAIAIQAMLFRLGTAADERNDGTIMSEMISAQVAPVSDNTSSEKPVLFTLATFNIENLMRRFDFTGYRNENRQDRSLQLFEIDSEAQYRLLEQARMVAHTDDTRQLSALSIAQTRADILCLQEVDDLEALNAFEYGYLFKMVGQGYKHKYLIDGNDSRGIDVSVMMRDTTKSGHEIELVKLESNAHLTYQDLGVYDPVLANVGIEAHERVFKRDCLMLDLRIGGKPLTLFVTHFKSMGGVRYGQDPKLTTLPVRMAEARAVRMIIEKRFGREEAANAPWVICGDFNDYYEKIAISGDQWDGYQFTPVHEPENCLNVFLEDGFAVNLVERRPELDRWTLYHTRGPQERHLCQLDYIWASPALAQRNAHVVPEIIRNGQPYRTVFPEGQDVVRFPRIGWDRPKASDHCPVAVTLEL
ncbi:endonuclease/exonuclease/phosphatase family protein [Pseudochrobactrum asaccharolyticum]|uniref:Endonuclease/exonuclease/phosphatase family protein n=3 Tax=Pseudochrobactrum asaccharolyticum TaxID=354351 RepID=A0A366E0E9_9HYPH|nr:endonuclease/exonuclease/phosphatase family protein [Pseudochrobactrum asaccharolyticum]